MPASPAQDGPAARLAVRSRSTAATTSRRPRALFRLPPLGDQYTLAAWVNLSSTSKQQRFMDYHSGTLTVRIASNGRWSFHWNPLEGASDSIGSTQASSKRWVHLVGTHDGKTARLYINGALDASSRTYTSALLSIGANGSNHVVDGLVDDVRIYNRALSGGEVESLFASTATAVSASAR
jgi:hypothetical protein